MNIIGTKVVFGVPDVMRPIVVDRRVPDGRIRLRFRVNKVATAFIRTRDGIVQYAIKDEDIRWCIGPALCLGMNTAL